MTSNSGEQYINGLKSGDRAIVKEIYTTVFPVVKSWIIKNSGNHDDALDVFHDALEVIIHQVFETNEIQLGEFEPYLFRICRNKWIDQLRKKKTSDKVRIEEEKRHEIVEQDEIELNKGLKSKFLNEALENTYQQISETCRTLIDLLNAGMTTAEVAAQMGMANSNTLYRRKFACMKRWRELLEVHPFYQFYKRENEA